MNAACSPKELALIRLLAYVADRFFADCCFDWCGSSPGTLTDLTRTMFGIEGEDFALLPGLARRGLVEETTREGWNATPAGRAVADFGTDLERRGALH